MSYTANQVESARAAEEISLLMNGWTYKETAAIMGSKSDTIYERNRLVYKVDIQRQFRQRMLRDGVPNRLGVTDAFGYWFSGFFDGEGSFGLYWAGGGRYKTYITVRIRDDDRATIDYIQSEFKVGRVRSIKSRNKSNPQVSFLIEPVKDLVEVVVPFFVRYPLRTKKGLEFEIWRAVVFEKYIETLGGTSSVQCEERPIFAKAMMDIAELRRYKCRQY